MTKINTLPKKFYFLYFPRNEPSKSVTVGSVPGRFIVLNRCLNVVEVTHIWLLIIYIHSLIYSLLIIYLYIHNDVTDMHIDRYSCLPKKANNQCVYLYMYIYVFTYTYDVIDIPCATDKSNIYVYCFRPLLWAVYIYLFCLGYYRGTTKRPVTGDARHPDI